MLKNGPLLFATINNILGFFICHIFLDLEADISHCVSILIRVLVFHPVYVIGKRDFGYWFVVCIRSERIKTTLFKSGVGVTQYTTVALFEEEREDFD